MRHALDDPHGVGIGDLRAAKFLRRQHGVETGAPPLGDDLVGHVGEAFGFVGLRLDQRQHVLRGLGELRGRRRSAGFTAVAV